MYLTTNLYHCHSCTMKWMCCLLPSVSGNYNLRTFVSIHIGSRCYVYMRVLHSWKRSATDEMCDVKDITCTWRRGFAFSSGPCRPTSRVENLHKLCMMYRCNTTNKSFFFILECVRRHCFRLTILFSKHGSNNWTTREPCGQGGHEKIKIVLWSETSFFFPKR